MMALGLGLIAVAFGALWWAEIIERDRLHADRSDWQARHRGGLCDWSGRAGVAQPDVQWIECPKCGSAFAGDGDLMLPAHTGSL